MCSRRRAGAHLEAELPFFVITLDQGLETRSSLGIVSKEAAIELAHDLIQVGITVLRLEENEQTVMSAKEISLYADTNRHDKAS